MKVLSEAGAKVELFVSNPELYKLYATHYSALYSYIHDLTRKDNPVKIHNMSSILYEAYILHKYRKTIMYRTNSNVLYFTLDFVNRDYHILKHLSKNPDNKIFYIKNAKLLDTIRAASIQNKLRVLVYRLLYGKDINLVKYGKKYFTRINDEFVMNTKVVDAHSLNVANHLQKPLNSIPIPKGVRILYFDSPFENSPDFESKQIHTLKIETLIEINKHVESIEKVAIKYHPWHITSSEFLKYGREIPSYIPAELVSLNSCEVVISFVSLSLSAEIIGTRHGICLIFLLPWSDNEIRDQYYGQMQTINPRLLYPKTISELSTVLERLTTNETE